MSTKWKPDGYSSVSPYLMVDGARRVIDFLKQVFNGIELRRQDAPDGSIRHVEVRLEDGSVIMMADGGGDYPAFPAWMHVYVPDVDATYQRALKAGSLSVQEPKQNEGEVDRRGGVKDPAGNTWWIATQVE
jgi:PhnB protein